MNILQQKIVECTQKITELGALPSHEVYSKFSVMSTKQLFKEMEKANNHLKKYRYINNIYKNIKCYIIKLIKCNMFKNLYHYFLF